MSPHVTVASWWIPSLFAILAVVPARAEPVALWLFDEPTGLEPDGSIQDAGPHGFSLRLGRGGGIVPGRFGHGLRPRTDAGAGDFVAIFPAGPDQRRPRWPNPTDTRLNLGEADWTIECWLKLEPAGAAEGVLFEIGTGPRGENDLLTRFSVLPRENAFALTAVAPGPPDLDAGKRIEYPNPGGPPQIVVHGEVATLALAREHLPRAAWVHVALVHRAVARDLHLFLDGKIRAVAATRLTALPHGSDAYVAVGCDGAGGRKLAGTIDELRVSDSAVYVEEFTPPRSFARAQSGVLREGPRVVSLTPKPDRRLLAGWREARWFAFSPRAGS